jgi:hypothetical protein
MKKGHLSQYFADVAYKRLSAVEALRHRSNQHEFDGVGGLKKMLGPERCTYSASFLYLCDEASEPIKDTGFLTWYDAREAHPTRSEYRLYFPDTRVSENANEGDLLVIGRRPDNSLVVIVAETGTTIENQILWLFGISDPEQPGFALKSELESDQVKLEFASRYILEQIGVEIEETDENYLERMLRDFKGSFPTTRIFSEFARTSLPTVGAFDNPDDVVIAWMEREEVLFRTLERHLIGDRLREGFSDDVDAFISFSLSVQNRRKSRAGSAFENHLEYIFVQRGIYYSRTPVTEGRSKPDFLFPGKVEYQDPSFPSVLLTMLGVKSSCKDRWRQILSEADRIDFKHLLTLEPGISENQTAEMQAKNVQLILPQRIHDSYTAKQQGWLMTIAGFVNVVEERQSTVSNSLNSSRQEG